MQKNKSGVADGLKKTEPISLQLYLSSPTIREYPGKLQAKYGRYRLPDEETRSLMDKTLGAKSLTEELYRMREA